MIDFLDWDKNSYINFAPITTFDKFLWSIHPDLFYFVCNCWDTIERFFYDKRY